MKHIKQFLSDLKSSFTSKMSLVFVIYCIVSVVSLLLSNIVVVKNFSFFEMTVRGYGISLTSSLIVFPIIYICSDIFSEVYGYRWSRITSWFSFIMNIFMVIIFEITILLPGSDQTVADAFKTVLGSSFGILAASLTAYMFGDLFNDVVFEFLKRKDTKKTNGSFIARSLISSLCGEVVDTGIFLPVLFLITKQFGTTITDFSQLVVIVLIQACLKVLLEIILSPLTIFLVKRTRKYEEKLDALPVNDKSVNEPVDCQ